VAAEGLTGNVEVEGYVPYQTLISELLRSTVAVFPSIYEAQSIAVLEAMACAKPVVAFDLPFSREIINHGETGLLARPMNERDLVECISRLLDSEVLRKTIGRNAQDYVRSYHDWKRIADAYVNVYNDLLSCPD
jgi:glycosyltransferase involved in cell wall biosynthesis